MANVLTGLIPSIYAGLNKHSREVIGFIPNVSTDAKASGAALNQVVRSPVVLPAVASSIVPGVDNAGGGSQTVGYTDVSITKSEMVPVVWSGEEQLAIGPNGTYNQILADQFTEAFRAISNQVETDLAAEYSKFARAYGIAGTTPFGTKDVHTDWSQSNKLLDDMGAPRQDRVMIVNSSSEANIEGIQSGLFHVNEAGDDGAMLRNREKRQIHRFTMGASAGIVGHTAGTGAGYLINDAALVKGGKTITVDTGTGTILVGDVVTIGNYKYVAATALAGGSFTIAGNGLAENVTDNTAITLAADYTPNAVYHKSALLLAARAPAMPKGGGKATDVLNVTDTVSGLTFQIASYDGYHQESFEVGLAWGVATPNPHFAGLLLG